MVDDTTSNTEPADDGTVILVSPEGIEVEASHPVTINDLVYGKGYRLKGDSDPEAAVKSASPEGAKQPETAERADTPTGEQTEVTAVSTPQAAGAKSAPSTTKSSGKPATGAPSTT